MHTANQIWIDAPPERVFRFAEAVERWPEILPHYRYVKLVERTGDIRTLRMGASRNGIPVRWAARLHPIPREKKLRFRHVGGVTKGMEVEWKLVRQRGGTHVTIEHELRLGWPPVMRTLGEMVIGRFFVSNIAGKTLRRMKQLSEARDDGE